jgi:hypothetical protein
LYLGHKLAKLATAQWVIRTIHSGHVWNLMKIDAAGAKQRGPLPQSRGPHCFIILSSFGVFSMKD